MKTTTSLYLTLYPVLLKFRSLHTAGALKGLVTNDTMRHVDRVHAACWVRGIRRNSRLGRLEYRLLTVKSR